MKCVAPRSDPPGLLLECNIFIAGTQMLDLVIATRRAERPIPNIDLAPAQFDVNKPFIKDQLLDAVNAVLGGGNDGTN